MQQQTRTNSLAGKVAVVTGASRGIGRGIALALGDAGATVYVTGRTVTPGSSPLPGTVGATAAEVDLRGGNAIAIPEELTQPGSFWDKPISNWEMIDVGLRSNFVAAWHAARIMVPQKSGLIVAISGYVGVTYTYNVVFGTCKSATDRMARDMAVELKPHNVASLSLWQGFTYTERALRNLQNNPAMKQLTVT